MQVYFLERYRLCFTEGKGKEMVVQMSRYFCGYYEYYFCEHYEYSCFFFIPTIYILLQTFTKIKLLAIGLFLHLVLLVSLEMFYTEQNVKAKLPFHAIRLPCKVLLRKA